MEYKGKIVCSTTYNDFTKIERRLENLRLKNFLRGKKFFTYRGMILSTDRPIKVEDELKKEVETIESSGSTDTGGDHNG